MKLFKNLYKNRKLLSFTFLNFLVFLLINAIKFFIRATTIWVIGYYLFEFMNMPFIVYKDIFVYYLLYEVANFISRKINQ